MTAENIRRDGARTGWRPFGTAAISAAVMLLGTAAPEDAAAASRLEEIKERGALRAAGVVYRPLMIRKPDGTYEGLDVEVMQQFADELGVELQIIDAGWDTAVAGITTGKWDIVPTICITPKRQEAVGFTEPYLQLGGALVVRADSAIETLEDANQPDVVFADIAGGWGEELATEAAPDATHKRFGQAVDADMVQEVLSGRADVTVMNTPVTTSLIKQRFGDKVRFIPGWDEPLGIHPCPVAYALPKDDAELKGFLDGQLEEIESSGRMSELMDKWITAEHAEED